MTSRTSFTISGSRALVGSSNRITSGFMAMARTIARRCFCPPDNFLGYSSFFSRSPTFFNSSSASSCACSFGTFFSRTGARVIFSSTVMFGNTLKCWNTMPIFWRCLSISIFLSVISTPSNVILPLSGTSRRFRHRKKVLFPLPLGPMMDTTSPIFTCWLMLRSTFNSPKPLHKFSTLMISRSCTCLVTGLQPPLDNL